MGKFYIDMPTCDEIRNPKNPKREGDIKESIIMEFKVLKNKTIVEIKGLNKGSEEVVFKCSDGTSYKMLHYQNCCEDVRVEDICGDIEDVLNNVILLAEEISYDEDSPKELLPVWYESDSFTWSFYKLATKKGYLTIRWLGESNGYYSESVDFIKIEIM